MAIVKLKYENIHCLRSGGIERCFGNLIEPELSIRVKQIVDYQEMIVRVLYSTRCKSSSNTLLIQAQET